MHFRTNVSPFCHCLMLFIIPFPPYPFLSSSLTLSPPLFLPPSLPLSQLPSTTSLDEEEEEPSDLLFEGDRLAQMLSSYQERIHNVVSEWMDHYREHIGIRPRSQIGSNIISRSLTRAASSRGGRRVKSSMSFGYGQSVQSAHIIWHLLVTCE